MLRRIVAAYLAFVTAAGPALCCCSLPRLAAHLTGSFPAAEEPPPCCRHTARPGQEEEPSCCHEPAAPQDEPAAPQDEQPPRDEPAPRRGRPDNDGGREGHCPCRDGGSLAAVVDWTGGTAEQPLAGDWLHASAPAAFDGHAVSPFGLPAAQPPPSPGDTPRLHLLC
jgi:hypothetical protein